MQKFVVYKKSHGPQVSLCWISWLYTYATKWVRPEVYNLI
jgi:hypothetical protein